MAGSVRPSSGGQAEDQLREALRDADLDARGLTWSDGVGEAAFYGPKIDIQARDAVGREETVVTVQLDFNQPERFDLGYSGADGVRRRVVMIHRGIVGSMERMIGLLLEVHDGRLPIWLDPVQVCLLPVGEAQHGAADAAGARLRAAGVRVRIERDGSLGRRLRAARRRRDALLAVVGADEASSDGLAVHDPATDERATLAVDDLRDRLTAAFAERRLRVELSG